MATPARQENSSAARKRMKRTSCLPFAAFVHTHKTTTECRGHPRITEPSEASSIAVALSKLVLPHITTEADVQARCDHLQQEYENLEDVKRKYTDDWMAKNCKQNAAVSKKVKGNLAAQKCRITKGKLEQVEMRQRSILWEIAYWRQRTTNQTMADVLKNIEEQSTNENEQECMDAAQVSNLNRFIDAEEMCALWRDEQLQEECVELLRSLYLAEPLSPVQQRLKHKVHALFGKIKSLKEAQAANIAMKSPVQDWQSQVGLKHTIALTNYQLKLVRSQILAAAMELKADYFQQQNASLQCELNAKQLENDQLMATVRGEHAQRQQQQLRQEPQESSLYDHNNIGEENTLTYLNWLSPSPLMGRNEFSSGDTGVSADPMLGDADPGDLGMGPAC